MTRTMTFGELLENLKAMPPERLNDTATVYVSGVDEYYPVVKWDLANADQDQLDTDHRVMIV